MILDPKEGRSSWMKFQELRTFKPLGLRGEKKMVVGAESLIGWHEV